MYSQLQHCNAGPVSPFKLTLQAVPWLRRLVTAEARVRAWVSPGGICGGQSRSRADSSPSSSVLPCQYHSTVALHMHIGPLRVVVQRQSHPINMNNTNSTQHSPSWQLNSLLFSEIIQRVLRNWRFSTEFKKDYHLYLTYPTKLNSHPNPVPLLDPF
jgi:hypothetical protein